MKISCYTDDIPKRERNARSLQENLARSAANQSVRTIVAI